MALGRRVLVFGAGPAGLSAALWLRNLGLDPLVLDTADRAGGLQNLNFLTNDWVLGQVGHTGPELAQRLVDHATSVGVPIRTAVRVQELVGTAGDFRLAVEGPPDIDVPVRWAAVLIATGTRYRGPEVLAGVDGLARVAVERFAFGPYAFADLANCTGRRILIVGGGDNAFENARLLAARGAFVYMAIRSAARAQLALAAAVEAQVVRGHCRLLQGASVVALSERSDGIQVSLQVAGTLEAIAVDRIHVLAGYEPNTRFIREAFDPALAAVMAFDKQGYITVDAAGHTGVAGIYAAGDVCNPNFPSVVSAIAQGALAAKSMEFDLRGPGAKP